MQKIYRTREGDVTAIDTKTQLDTQGSNSAPGPLLVPNSAKYIIGVIGAAVSDMAAATDQNHLLRFEGPGLVNGPESLVIGGEGAQTTTGGMLGQGARCIDLCFPVTPNQEILVFGEIVGEDPGQATMGGTLVFADSQGNVVGTTKTLTLEGDLNSVDTLTQLTAQGSVSTPSRVTPADAKYLDKIVANFGVDGAAEGSGVIYMRIGGPAVMNGEQVIMIGAAGTNTVQSGSDAAPITSGLVELKDLAIPIHGSEVIDAYVELAGEDLGDVAFAATLFFK